MSFPLRKGLLVSLLVSLLAGVAGIASAHNEAARAIYDASGSIPTNIEGVHTFPAPPRDFDALSASDETLASYGLPPRPDRAADPAGYRSWAEAIGLRPERWNGTLTVRKAAGSSARFANNSPGGGAAVPTSNNGVTNGNSVNWSGVVNQLPLNSYSATQSFYLVTAQFTVPVAQQAFSSVTSGNICDGDSDFISSWVGLDGFGQPDVLQGGTDSIASCKSNLRSTSYYAWAEWYPGAAIRQFFVNPGDDMYVVVWNSGDRNGCAFVEDKTLRLSATYCLTAPSGITLKGNQAEYILERCGGDSLTANHYFPLANYISSVWNQAKAQTINDVLYYPGLTTSTTNVVSMSDDGGLTISTPTVGAASGLGPYSIWFQNQNCSVTGGCPP
jgi:Peptidase A4 family